jgi:hypothetical protein
MGTLIAYLTPKLIGYALIATLLMGGVAYYRHSVIVSRDAYWTARLDEAAKRVHEEINQERRASAERTAELNKTIDELQQEIDANDAIIDQAPDATDNGISADSVRRLNRVR